VSSTRDIRNKIRAVRNIEQICRAMKTVASIRLRRTEQRLEAARPYCEGLASLAGRLAALLPDHPLLAPRPAGRTGLILFTSDRGLCGGYNAGAVRRALSLGEAEQVAVFAVGRRGQMHMARRGYAIVDRIIPLGGEPDLRLVARLADRVGQRYWSGELDRVVLVYSKFLGGARFQVRADTALPIEPQAIAYHEAIFEPALPDLLPGLLERYLRSRLVAAALESSASEHAARVSAMTAATDNAEEMIRDLTLDYNQARQAGITRELTEIVSTAEATA